MKPPKPRLFAIVSAAILVAGAGLWFGLDAVRLSRLDLEPLPQPDLSAFEDPVREEIQRAHRSANRWWRKFEANLDLARYYHAHEMFDCAAVCYRRALDIHPRDGEARYLLGRALLSDGQVVQGLAALESATRRIPDHAPLWVKLAQVRLNENRLDQAQEATQRALASSPRCSQAVALQGRIAARRGNLDRAIQLYQQALNWTPGDGSVRYALVQAYRRSGRTENAQAQLSLLPERVVPVPPQDDIMRNMRAFNHSRRRQAFLQGVELVIQQKPVPAIPLLLQAFHEEPDSPLVQYYLGQALLDAGRAAEALRVSDATVEDYPHYVRAWVVRGDALVRLNRTDPAERSYRRAIDLDPNWPDPYAKLAQLLLSQKRYSEGVESLQHAIHLDPGDALQLFGLADALFKSGEVDRAERHVRDGLVLQPANAGARLLLAQIHFSRGDLEDAVREAREGFRMSPALAERFPDWAARVESGEQSHSNPVTPPNRTRAEQH